MITQPSYTRRGVNTEGFSPRSLSTTTYSFPSRKPKSRRRKNVALILELPVYPLLVVGPQYPREGGTGVTSPHLLPPRQTSSRHSFGPIRARPAGNWSNQSSLKPRHVPERIVEHDKRRRYLRGGNGAVLSGEPVRAKPTTRRVKNTWQGIALFCQHKCVAAFSETMWSCSTH